ALHRDRHAHRDGVLVHEHHSGGNSRRRLRHRLPAAEILDAATDQSHLRRAADDLHSRISDRPGVPHPGRPHTDAFHVVRGRHLRAASERSNKRERTMRRTMILGLAATGLLAATATTYAQQAPLKLTLFGQPSVNNDAIWM